eukprot:Clim_evm71s236 gene=Clim_evmTU71s236
MSDEAPLTTASRHQQQAEVYRQEGRLREALQEYTEAKTAVEAALATAIDAARPAIQRLAQEHEKRCQQLRLAIEAEGEAQRNQAQHEGDVNENANGRLKLKDITVATGLGRQVSDTAYDGSSGMYNNITSISTLSRQGLGSTDSGGSASAYSDPLEAFESFNAKVQELVDRLPHVEDVDPMERSRFNTTTDPNNNFTDVGDNYVMVGEEFGDDPAQVVPSKKPVQTQLIGVHAVGDFGMGTYSGDSPRSQLQSSSLSELREENKLLRDRIVELEKLVKAKDTQATRYRNDNTQLRESIIRFKQHFNEGRKQQLRLQESFRQGKTASGSRTDENRGAARGFKTNAIGGTSDNVVKSGRDPTNSRVDDSENERLKARLNVLESEIENLKKETENKQLQIAKLIAERDSQREQNQALAVRNEELDGQVSQLDELKAQNARWQAKWDRIKEKYKEKKAERIEQARSQVNDT